MHEISNFTTFKVKLIPKSRAISIELDLSGNGQKIGSLFLSELGTLFNWVAIHSEIQAIVISSSGQKFCQGFDENEIVSMNQTKLKNMLMQLKKIVTTMFYLPQIIIVDLMAGAKGIGIELSLGANFRLCQKNCTLDFDHLNLGIMPCCGGITILSKMIAPGYVQNWLLSNREIRADELVMSGFICDSYSDRASGQSLINGYLEHINSIPPVQRFQMKQAFIEVYRVEIEQSLKRQENIAFAGLVTEDWREVLLAKREERSPKYTSYLEMKTMIKNLESGAH